MSKIFLSLCNLLLAANLLQADSLWREGRSRSMVGDKRAAAVGDILNIVVQENSTATKDNKTKTSKASAIDSSIQAFLYSPAASKLLTKGGTLPAVKLNGNQSFDGGGTINNAENIIARIAVQVIDVLPNQNLIVEGRRRVGHGARRADALSRGQRGGLVDDRARGRRGLAAGGDVRRARAIRPRAADRGAN